MSFGSSSELEEYEADAGMSAEGFRAKHGDAFLLISASAADAAVGASAFEDATDANIRLNSKAQPTRCFVFCVKKRTATEFSFIAIGRNVGNDVHIPHPSVSRFHAYFRPTDGGMVVQDAKSSTGITLNDKPVPKPTEGEAQRVVPGDVLRFGAISARFVNAAGLLSELKASGASFSA